MENVYSSVWEGSRDEENEVDIVVSKQESWHSFFFGFLRVSDCSHSSMCQCRVKVIEEAE